jgi:tetratricopeptide (TPR) repeat protein
MNHRRRIIGAVAIVAALMAAGIWYWSPPGPPAPTETVLEHVDPRVRSFVESHHDRARFWRRSPSAWGELAKAYEANHLVDLASECYRRLVEMDSANARWWYGLAMTHHKMGHWNEAMTAIDHAIAADRNEPHLIWRKGIWQYEQGHFEEAEGSFRSVLTKWPNDTTSKLGLAQVHLAGRRYDEAAELLKGRDLLTGPQGDYARRLLGFAYQAMGQEEAARQFQDSTLGGQPVWEDDWTLELGRYRKGILAEVEYTTLLLQSGQVPGAIQILERLKGESPQDKTILNNLAKAYLEVGDFDRAKAILTDLGQLSPNDPSVKLSFAKVSFNSGHTIAARAYVDEAIQIDPSYAPAHRLKGILAERAGRFAESISAYETAARFDARDAALFVSLGDANSSLGRWASASDHYQTAVERDPALASAWAKLAAARWELNRNFAAREALHRAADLDPDDLTVRRLQAKHHLEFKQSEH